MKSEELTSEENKVLDSERKCALMSPWFTNYLFVLIIVFVGDAIRALFSSDFPKCVCDILLVFLIVFYRSVRLRLKKIISIVDKLIK